MRHLAAVLVVATALTAAAAIPVTAQDPAAPADAKSAEAADAAPAPADRPAEGAEPKVEMNELEKKFERTMSGATLVGRFTVTGQGDDDKPPAEERYAISKVTKVGAETWVFFARIGEAKVAVPLPLPVKWAGDTPVITVTKVKVPGMGTYTARVLVYDDQYAGTWDAGDHGGHLWGRIEREGEKKAGAKEPAPAGKDGDTGKAK